MNYLKRFKKDFPELSWADIIQLASAVSIELAGGPKIPMRCASALPASLPSFRSLTDCGPCGVCSHASARHGLTSRLLTRYGRVDATGPEECPPEGNLPGAAGPFDDAAGSNPFPGAEDPQVTPAIPIRTPAEPEISITN